MIRDRRPWLSRLLVLLAVAVAAAAGFWAGRTTLPASPEVAQAEPVWGKVTTASVGRSIPVSVTVRRPVEVVAQNALGGVVTQVHPGLVQQGGVLYEVGETKVGDTISVYGELVRVGRSSLDLRIEVWRRGLLHTYQEAYEFVTEGMFTYVAIDESGKPRPFPDNPLFFTRP